MLFDIKEKVALITGGASGIGLNYAKELLRNGAKAVTLADVNSKHGQDALEEIESEFGSNRAIYTNADVTDIKQFEAAFQKAVETFGHIDILINNAGILNDNIWEKEILINVNGVIHGMLLGMEKYISKCKQGSDGVIVNISSIAGITGSAQVPVYSASKHAIIGLTKSWGDPRFYKRNEVRVVAVCPGVTITPLITEMSGRNLGDTYEEFITSDVANWPVQQPSHIAKEMMNVIKYAPHGSVWVIEGGEPAYQYVVPERETMKENTLTVAS